MNQLAIPTHVSNDKLPPQSIETEINILGACMLLGCDHVAVMNAIRPQDFYRGVHQEIFAAIKALYDRREPIDPLTVHEFLVKAGSSVSLNELNGIVNQTPHVSSAVRHAAIVHQYAVSREVLRVAEQIRADVYSERFSSDEAVARLQLEATRLSSSGTGAKFATTRDMLDAFYSRQAARSAGKALKVYTGLRELDDIIGGFEAGQLIVIGARTSNGKSALCSQIMDHVGTDQGLHVLMFSLEVTWEALMDRILPSRARVSRTNLERQRLTADENRRLLDADQEIGAHNNFFTDTTLIRTPESVVAAVRGHNAQHPGRIGAVIVDYVQLMVPDEGSIQRASKQRHEYIADITRRLKLLAEEIKVPVIIAAQVNRDSEKSGDGRPKLHHLRESGSLEMDANIVILIHRPEVADPEDMPGIAELNVAKNRDGETGTVQVRWKKWCTRFVPMEEPDDFDPYRSSPF
ncbi:DnaB-like helicase C-terminal domain-containing protein (plasmid) [Isosphaeraceae bacterium EP7]